MFNSYSVDNSQSIKINAVSGTLVKNYRDSFILRFHMKSNLAESILSKKPYMVKKTGWIEGEGLYDRGYEKDIKEPVVVLQVMLCGNEELLAEVMWKEDFDKMFGVEQEE